MDSQPQQANSPMATRKDMQRERLYLAERDAFEGHIQWSDMDRPTYDTVLESLIEFPHLDECKAYVRTVQSSEHWQNSGGGHLVRVHCGAGNRRATWCDSRKEVKLPRWSRKRWVICHELAHGLTHQTHRHSPAHGSAFARHYIELVREMLGEQPAARLEDEFYQRDVRIMSTTDLLKKAKRREAKPLPVAESA